MDKLGWKFYMVFMALNIVDLGIIAVLFPETKGKCLHSFTLNLILTFVLPQGKTLEEMNRVFGDSIDTRKVLEEHNIPTTVDEKHDDKDREGSTEKA